MELPEVRRSTVPATAAGGGRSSSSSSNPSGFLSLFRHNPEAGYLYRRFLGKAVAVVQELAAITQAAAEKQGPACNWEELWRSNLRSLRACSSMVRDQVATEFLAEVPDIQDAARSTYHAYASLFYTRSKDGGINRIKVTVPPFSLFLFEFLTYALHNPLVPRALQDHALLTEIADNALMDSLRAVLQTRVQIMETVPEHIYRSRKAAEAAAAAAAASAGTTTSPRLKSPPPFSSVSPDAKSVAAPSTASTMSALGMQWKTQLGNPSSGGGGGAGAAALKPSDSATSMSFSSSSRSKPAVVSAPALPAAARIIQRPAAAAAAPAASAAFKPGGAGMASCSSSSSSSSSSAGSSATR